MDVTRASRGCFVEDLFMSFFVPRGLKARNKLLTKIGKSTRGEVVCHRTVKFLKVEMVGRVEFVFVP